MLKNKKYFILSQILRYSFVFILAFTLVMPFVVGAADSSTPGKKSTPDSSTPGASTKVTGINFTIKNPIKVNSIPELIKTILEAVIIIGVPIVALAIIYCGFLFVQARGNGEEIKKAKTALIYTIVGAMLLLGSWVLAQAIQSTVEDIISTT